MMITRSICNLIDTIVMRTEDRFLDLDTMPKEYPQRAALEKSIQVYNIETMNEGGEGTVVVEFVHEWRET